MNRLPLASLLLAFAVPLAHAQAPAKPPPATAEIKLPAYDIFTIKPNKSGSGSSGTHSHGDIFSATNVTVKQLLEQAFSIRQDLISGIPNTIDSARFDIQAKIVDFDPDAMKKLSDKQRGAMLQPLLADRFHLTTHRETKTLPVYELVVIPGGPKFKPSPVEARDANININGRRDHTDLTAKFISMTLLADILSGQVQRTVVDKTGLASSYDLTLQWSRDDSSTPDTDTAPSIYTALPEQLGLKLQPAKGPVETLVVDHVEMPTEN